MHSMAGRAKVLLGYPDGGRIAILPTETRRVGTGEENSNLRAPSGRKNKRMNPILRQQGVHMPFPMRRGRARTIDTCARAHSVQYTTQSAGALTTHYGPLSG